MEIPYPNKEPAISVVTGTILMIGLTILLVVIVSYTVMNFGEDIVSNPQEILKTKLQNTNSDDDKSKRPTSIFQNLEKISDEPLPIQETRFIPSTNNWMKYLNDQSDFADLSIPGTHDSGAIYDAVIDDAKTQSETIREQLEHGIRFLDIRCKQIGGSFHIYHGSVSQKQDFQDVLNSYRDFLSQNPSETIIMMIKEEGTPDSGIGTFGEVFDSYYYTNKDLLMLDTQFPVLGDARGKVLIIRRFADLGNCSACKGGIDMTTWPDNAKFYSQDAHIMVDDRYNLGCANPSNEQELVDKKWSYLNAVFQVPNNRQIQDAVYLNYASGYVTHWYTFCSWPAIKPVSNCINQKLDHYFTNTHYQKSYGVIIMDYSTQDLNQKIIKWNQFVGKE